MKQIHLIIIISLHAYYIIYVYLKWCCTGRKIIIYFGFSHVQQLIFDAINNRLIRDVFYDDIDYCGTFTVYCIK